MLLFFSKNILVLHIYTSNMKMNTYLFPKQFYYLHASSCNVNMKPQCLLIIHATFCDNFQRQDLNFKSWTYEDENAKIIASYFRKVQKNIVPSVSQSVSQSKKKHLFQYKLSYRSEIGINHYGLLSTSVWCFEMFLRGACTWGGVST